MTPHQRARRAAKSKAFFAKLAERAAISGNRPEAQRLLTWAVRKRTDASLAAAVLRTMGGAATVAAIVALAACNPPPRTVAVGLGCGSESARVYATADAPTAARVCREVQIHRLP